jgi:hypothetical protein
MDPEALIKSLKELVEALREDLSEQITKMDTKHTAAIADAVKKFDTVGMRRREPDEKEDDDVDGDPTAAKRVAADSVGRGEFASLASTVARLKPRPMADLNQFADAQAKADTVMRALGGAAEPPMAFEDLVAYEIRLARKMQPHSAKWKGVELNAIAADKRALANVIGEIRSDAMTAAMSPVGMPEFQHRMITEILPGGHVSRRFIGNGTIFKQMSRPIRKVAYIGTRQGVSSL